MEKFFIFLTQVILGVYFLWRKRELPPLFLKILVAMTFSGWIGTVSGWYACEVGLQPGLVTGIFKSKGAGADLPPENVAITLAAYLVTHAILRVAYVASLFYLTRKETAAPSKPTNA